MNERERVTIFGDVSYTPIAYIRRFMETTRHLYGGTYPSHQAGLPDEAVICRTRATLTEAGILDTSPIILCSSAEDRMRQILENCSLRRRKNGAGLYWIVDENPNSLTAAVRSIRDQNDHEQAEILAVLTITKLNSTQMSDYRDIVTGIRVVTVPLLYHVPT